MDCKNFSILQTVSLIFRSNLPHGCCRHRSAIEWVNLRVNGIQKTHLKIPSAISLHAEKESVLVMWMFTIVYIFFVLASWAALFPFFRRRRRRRRWLSVIFLYLFHSNCEEYTLQMRKKDEKLNCPPMPYHSFWLYFEHVFRIQMMFSTCKQTNKQMHNHVAMKNFQCSHNFGCCRTLLKFGGLFSFLFKSLTIWFHTQLLLLKRTPACPHIYVWPRSRTTNRMIWQ